MPSQQFQLRGHSLESLRWQLFEKYGAAARIVRAEKIQTGGLFGLGAATSFEVTVELASPAEQAAAARAGMGSLRTDSSRRAASTRRAAAPRRSMGELLAAADDGDDARPSTPHSRGSKPDFQAILSSLTEQDPLAAPSEGSVQDLLGAFSPAGAVGDSTGRDEDVVPRPLTTPGALVVLVGRRDQPFMTAWSMAAHLQDGADILTAGDYRHSSVSHVFLDSIEVKKARSAAASSGKPLLIAFSFGQRGASNLAMLASLRPQQLWFVVDAAHKPEDTESWVGRACRYSVPDALAVLGVTDTATPESVNALRIPVGWVDGRQAATSEL